MGLATPEAPTGSGLKTAIDIVIAPKDAFEALRAVPTWGWALVVALVLMLAGYFLQQPAVRHASLGTLTHAIMSDVLQVTPSLALLAPGATGKLATFLAGIQIFTLWGFALNVAMMRITAGVRNALSWAFPLLILIAGAAFQTAASGFYG